MKTVVNEESNANILEKMKAKYSYCDKIQWVPFPSASPEFYQGQMPICSKTGYAVSNIAQCMRCEDFHGEEDTTECHYISDEYQF